MPTVFYILRLTLLLIKASSRVETKMLEMKFILFFHLAATNNAVANVISVISRKLNIVKFNGSTFKF